MNTQKTILSIAVALAFCNAASADHSIEHPEPPIINPPEQHHEPVGVMVPVVEPPPQLPPIVPPVVPPPVNLQLPATGPSSIILPTDVSGFHTNIENVVQQSPIDKAGLLSKDPRFRFTGEWIPFALDVSTNTQTDFPYRAVSLIDENSSKFGHVEHIESSQAQAVFMPTIGASFERINGHHLKLTHGAIVVRAVAAPVLVSAKLCDESVTAKIGGSALALMSAFESKPTILNLADSSANAVSVYIPAGSGQSHLLKLRPGQIAEAYKLDSKPTSNLVARKIVLNQKIGPHCGLLVSQCHYVRALRKFNLVAALPKDQYSRVLKTAASLQYIHR